MFLFSRIALFLVAVAGWGMLFFGAWVGWRGLTLYALDHVLVGTGGGLFLGGLLVVALSVGANAQVSTARDTAAMRRLMEAGGDRPAPPEPAPRGPSLRAEPRMPSR